MTMFWLAVLIPMALVIICGIAMICLKSFSDREAVKEGRQPSEPWYF